VRRETPQDGAAIRTVNEKAFGGPAEADLVDALRRGGALALSLVAVEADQIVGHIASVSCPPGPSASAATTPSPTRSSWPWSSGRAPSADVAGSPDPGRSSAPC